MAGLCGLKILLLWIEIISLANCQDSSGETGNGNGPATPTTHPNKTNIQTDSDNKTSPAVTQLNTTVTPTTQAPPTTPAPPPQCSYTVTPIKFGFQINITSSTTGNYNITINEEGRPDTENKSMVQHSSQNSSHEIKHLKPCTEYEHSVTFIDTSAGRENIHCNSTEKDNKTTTIEMSKDDIKDATSCIPGYVCYQTDWNITSLQSTPNKIQDERCGSKTLCVKLGYNDICTDFTTTITSETCGNSSFNFTKNISIDFLNVSEINQTAPTELPAKINTTLPPNCKSLSIDYSCRERGRVNESKKLSELEPFTDYNCTGQIKDNDGTVKKTTAPVHIYIKCDFDINTKKSSTNTSIELSSTTTSKNCQQVPQNLLYNCSCSRHPPGYKITANNHPPGGTCHVTGLQPYTNYTCEVQPIYNNKRVPESKSYSVTEKTKSGIPDPVTNLKVTVPEHNVIHVKCDHSKNSKGPENKCRVRLITGGVIVDKTDTPNSNLEFRDLSYSTTYTVKVTVFNGDFESEPKTDTVHTQYNDKAVIGFFIFLIILIISVVVAVVVYKLYIKKRKESRNGVNEGVTLESTAIYMNVPPREWHHKETH
ncbi:receptor-type tyrosine-protein phosphatase C isoform X2 [Lates calcarifer]|uniref:Receptor-type tyrosine-protein phosphatase C isoform X2 n=1 Tax=Lates calcarifer TaxID=8187 RepID=A0AAJ7PIQ8_LATCA|nr:receptor-type tyrosine-protein phosphatase C isoform X2 [Lates calcarifer]